MKLTTKPAGWLRPGMAAACVLAACAGTVTAQNVPPAPATPAEAERTNDILIFRSGQVLEGTILSETATTLKFKGAVGTLSFETEYSKSDILDIKRATKKADPNAKTPAVTAAAAAPAAAPPPIEASDKTPYYWIDLKGEFGEDISETPLRAAIRDAKSNSAKVILIHLDAKWNPRYGEALSDLDASNIDAVFRSEAMTDIFASEIPREWENPPRVIFWVKQAMQGAAFLPLVCPEIYFHNDGRLGGLGGLSYLFRGVGDEIVQEKQISLRLGHAEGWVRVGGYDHRLVRAMSKVEMVMSYRIVNGKAELFEGYPANPSEELLTDDGKEQNADSIQERGRGLGNDVLTLNERTARIVGVSKGTVDTREDLLAELGLDRGGREIKGRSDRIMKDWAEGLDNAKRNLRRLIRDYGDVEVDDPNNYANRTKARGKRTAILNEIKGIVKRWKESLDQGWLQDNNIPPEDVINTLIDRIKIEQQMDKR